MFKRSIIRVVIFTVAIAMLYGCKSKVESDQLKEREYQRKLAEAQELAKQIREGDLFNENQIIQERIKNPDNVCAFTTSYQAVDFGPDPDFRGDGYAALYNDTGGIVYYFDLGNRQRYKMWQYGRDPSFGMLLPDGNQKFIYQDYDLVKTDEGTEKKILGLLMNTDKDWLRPPKNLYEGEASKPYFVNEDRTVIFVEADKYWLLDEQLQKKEITEEEYNQLRDSRFTYENTWKLMDEYRGKKGIWVTDHAELNWVQLRDTTDLSTIEIMPVSYHIYCWGNEFAGILELSPTDLPNYSIKLNEGLSASVGELFDVYEKKLSPISQEVIGYKKDQLKGTLRVIKIVEGHLVCEFQTKLYQNGIFKDDAAVSKSNPQTIGKIL